MTSPRVAVVGAGLELAGDLVALLLEHGIAGDHLRILGHEETAGETIEAGDLRRRIEWATPETLAGADIVLFCGSDELARALLPVVRARGAIAIDATDVSRANEDVPLVVPAVNAERLSAVAPGSVIASPTPAVVGLATALAPLHRLGALKRVVVTAIEPASQAGASAIEELSRQSVQLMQGQGLDRSEFSEQIAFNLRVQAPESEAGWSVTETAIARELRILFGAPDLPVAATVVRAPVFFGSAQAVHFELARELQIAEVEEAIRGAQGLLLAGSVEDRLAVAVEAARRRKERAALHGASDDERDVAEELVEDGLEEIDEDERAELDDEDDAYAEERRARYAEDAPEGRRRRPAGGAGDAPASDEVADLLPGPVDVSGSEFVHVARLRLDPGVPGGGAFWLAFDELRRGSAMNVVAIVDLVQRLRA